MFNIIKYHKSQLSIIIIITYSMLINWISVLVLYIFRVYTANIAVKFF